MQVSPVLFIVMIPLFTFVPVACSKMSAPLEQQSSYLTFYWSKEMNKQYLQLVFMTADITMIYDKKPMKLGPVRLLRNIPGLTCPMKFKVYFMTKSQVL